MSTQQALEMALAGDSAGELNQAESLYQQILVHTPNNPDAWHLLGVIAHRAVAIRKPRN